MATLMATFDSNFYLERNVERCGVIRFGSILPLRMGIVVLGVVLAGVGLGACQSSQESRSSPSKPQGEQASGRSETVNPKSANHQELLRSIPSWEPRSGLAYTSPNDRLSQVKVGRPDPFAPTETIVVNVDSKPAENLVAQAPLQTSPLQASSLPLAPLQLAPLQTVPVAVNASLVNTSQPLPLAPVNSSASVPVQELPPLSIAPTVALSPTHLADQMQLKGIVELNQQWQAIVWEPQNSVSKTVRAGDVLGNGQVRVRRIEQTSNGLLRLVLEQNGIEVIHTVS